MVGEQMAPEFIIESEWICHKCPSPSSLPPRETIQMTAFISSQYQHKTSCYYFIVCVSVWAFVSIDLLGNDYFHNTLLTFWHHAVVIQSLFTLSLKKKKMLMCAKTQAVITLITGLLSSWSVLPT